MPAMFTPDSLVGKRGADGPVAGKRTSGGVGIRRTFHSDVVFFWPSLFQPRHPHRLRISLAACDGVKLQAAVQAVASSSMRLKSSLRFRFPVI